MQADTIINTLSGKIDEIFESMLIWLEQDSPILNYIPDDEEWSIRQILEHVSLVNHYLLKLITKGRKKALKCEDPALIEDRLTDYRLFDERLEEIGINDSFAWECPEHMKPSGNISLGKIKERMIAQNDRCRQTLESLKRGQGVLIKITMSVHGLGKLDVYQYIYFLLMHAQRHLQQMEKIRSSFLQ